MPTELHSGHGGPSMVLLRVETIEAIFVHLITARGLGNANIMT